ncbi:hypothetical protein B8V81_0708 [Paenibacillus pasadenensis]|uniref:Uncharacterized protein n=1 Tax=Paenibacillus pasadenensis TaxID=217090 RepID=A0A2N5NBU0_9BACL|nr:hypothetical protein B8V81_0708 [Paenibacillus pasadenensis]
MPPPSFRSPALLGGSERLPFIRRLPAFCFQSTRLGRSSRGKSLGPTEKSHPQRWLGANAA